MKKEEWLLVEAIESDLRMTYDALSKLDDLELYGGSELHTNPEDDRHDTATLILSYHIECAFRGIGALAERLGVFSIEREVSQYRKNNSNLGKTIRYDGDIHSDAFSKANAFFAPLRAMSNAKAITTHEVLKSILTKTSVIINERGLVPTSEAEVRNAVLEVCRYSFADAMREVGIPKIIKHYKGDLAVPSLRTMVEFKFISSKAEMKASLDGVYADMKGYTHHEWDTFYGVFYMTEPFYTQEDVEREFEFVNAERSWTPIVIHGPGGRVKRAK